MQDQLTLTSRRSLYENIVLNVLSEMRQGSLELTLPAGERVVIGAEDGKRVAANMTVNHREFYKRCILWGDIGFGDAYVDGLWDTDNITEVIKWILLNIEHAPGLSGSKTTAVGLNLLKGINRLSHFLRANSLKGARKNISEHYDLNNDFFETFLDPTMTYSSAYFREESMSLEQAQLAKYDRLCRQLHIQPSDHVLEIGSGWGGNAIYMAKNYGCRVTSLTISEEQLKLARKRVEEAGLSDRVTIRLEDYRRVEGLFDKIVSVEMLEAVGHAYFEPYFRKCHQLLKKNGILALQVITCPDPRYASLRKGVDWIQKRIFPGSLLPSVGVLNRSVNRTGDLTMVDLKDIGLHYARTLGMWFDKFNANLSRVRSLGFDEKFIRKWNYYLCYCQAAFAMRNINVMQIVYTRPNNTAR